jgi:tetratricopeptide (TPR) repeat protein
MNEIIDNDPESDPDMQHVGRLMLEGRLPEAETVLREVITRKPRAPDPHYVLGILCLNGDRLTEAETAFGQAVMLDPDFAEAHYQLGMTLSALGKTADALAAYQCAVVLDPDLADAYYRSGIILSAGGRTEDAAAAYQRAVAIDPAHADAQTRLGDMLTILGQGADAVTAFRAAAAAAPGQPIGVFATVKALEYEGKLPEAEAVLRRFIVGDPSGDGSNGDVGRAYHLLGMVTAQLGQFDDAVAAFDRAITMMPNSIEAYFGRVSAAKITKADQPTLDGMVALLTRKLPDRAQMILHFALGKALDDIADYGGAIQHFDAANAIRGRFSRLNRLGLSTWVDRLIARCTPEFLDRNRTSGSNDHTPVLILGMPRSGTTLLEQILSSHPGIAAGGELTYWNTYGPDWANAGPAGFGSERATGIANGYSEVLRRISPNASRVTDKEPWNFQWIGMIRQLMPNARFIHCRRDPVDTCLSIYFTHFLKPQDFMNDRGDLAFYYRQYARLMAQWRRVLPPDRFTEVDYETLIANREQETRHLVEFCGLPWNDACLRPEENRQIVRTASVWQARQPVYNGSMERWRRYEPWLGALADLG